MVQIDNWDEFAEKSMALYRDDPVRCRLTTKYRARDGMLQMKATDDRVVYIYLAKQRDIKNIDSLLAIFMQNAVKSQ